MNFYELFFRVVMTVSAVLVFGIAMFMTFVAGTQDVYPWKRAWPYVLFGWATCGWIFWLAIARH